jgi:short subunit dehydrogenase-like uncharacterized protein
MRYNVLLYGATGYSGGLIATEGKERGMSRRDSCNFQMILAARNRTALWKVAEENGMECRIFGLDDPDEVGEQLGDIDIVINAAGPFAFTAERLAKAAVKAGCHYVDINGEIDVYMKLDDLGLKAAQCGVALVSAAGDTAGASDILLDAALRRLLSRKRINKRGELGTIRIAVSRFMDFSRGSAETAARLLREQVLVIRKGWGKDRRGRLIEKLVNLHEPIGKLEHAFDFNDRDKSKGCHPQIASAANLIDTLTARSTLERLGLSANAIESYVEMGTVGRIAYQLGGMFASLNTLPWIRTLTEAQLSFLPAGPGPQELARQRHVVLLEIEDLYRTRLVDWRLETPNVYQFTAQLAVAVARRVVDSKLTGWVTPATVLNLPINALHQKDSDRDKVLRGCTLQERTV